MARSDNHTAVHRTQMREFAAGIATLAVLGVITWVGVQANSGGSIPTQTYTYAKAEFTNTGILEPRQDVRVDSVPIGQITDVQYRDGVDGGSAWSRCASTASSRCTPTPAP